MGEELEQAKVRESEWIHVKSIFTRKKTLGAALSKETRKDTEVENKGDGRNILER